MNYSLILYRVFILLLITKSLFSQQKIDFAIYHDGGVGAWENGIIAFESFLDWKGVTHKRVNSTYINLTSLRNNFNGIFFPGGDADYYNADIELNGIKNIQDLVFNNGAYIGMCAGAEFACDKLVWKDVIIDYPLNLFEGIAVGPIDAIAVWPDYDITTVSMNLNDEINIFENEKEDMLYWGGTVFNAYSNTIVDTIATYDKYNSEPAIIKFNYGNGRVLLISPHPEIEEDSNRDNVKVAEELNDNGSDWNFLWTATDWLLGNTLSKTNSKKDFLKFNNLDIAIYPNPTRSVVNITSSKLHEVEKAIIFDQYGNKMNETNSLNQGIDLSNFSKGLYILEIWFKNGVNIKKKVILE